MPRSVDAGTADASQPNPAVPYPPMSGPTSKSAEQLLGEVHRLAQVEAFDEDGFIERLRAELASYDDAPATDEARDAKLRAALAAIDAFACRAMRIRLDHLLADDTSVAGPFRSYLATRVVDYVGDLERLRARVAQVCAHNNPGGAATTAAAITGAAGDVLALRERLRARVLELARAAEPPEQPAEDRPEPTFFELIELD